LLLFNVFPTLPKAGTPMKKVHFHPASEVYTKNEFLKKSFYKKPNKKKTEENKR